MSRLCKALPILGAAWLTLAPAQAQQLPTATLFGNPSGAQAPGRSVAIGTPLKFFTNTLSLNQDIGASGLTGGAHVRMISGLFAKATATGNANLVLLSSDLVVANPLAMSQQVLGSATATLRRGEIQVSEYGLATYRELALQPSGGNVSIGLASGTAPSSLLDVRGDGIFLNPLHTIQHVDLWPLGYNRIGHRTSLAKPVGLLIEQHTPVIVSASAYEAAAMLIEIRNDDPSVAVGSGSSATDFRCFITSVNPAGACWSLYGQTTIEPGGDGVGIGAEISVENGGTSQPLLATATTKYNVKLTSRTNPNTVGLYFEPTGPGWHKGIWATPASLSGVASSRFIELDGKFSITKDGFAFVGGTTLTLHPLAALAESGGGFAIAIQGRASDGIGRLNWYSNDLGTVYASLTSSSSSELLSSSTIAPGDDGLRNNGKSTNAWLGVYTRNIIINGSTAQSMTQTVQATAGNATVTWGTGTGTPAVTASSPLAITTATGNITCSTCLTNVLTNTHILVGNGSNVATDVAMSGDATLANTGALTLATVNITTGTFGSATQVAQVTANGKGLITTLSNVTITPAIGSVTGLGTGVATALAVNVGTAGAFVVNGGALGSPSSAGTMPAFTLGGSISGGGQTVTNLASLALRDTSAAFDVTIAAMSSTNLTAGRALTLDMGNVAHTLKFGTSTSTVTFPTGTVTLVETGVATLSSLASIGTVTTGTWNATVVAGLYGGTGLSTAAVGDLIYASATTPTWSRLADVAAGSVLVSGGIGSAPSWSAAITVTTSIATAALSGTTSTTTPLIIGGSGAGSSVEIRSTSGTGTSDFTKFTGGTNGGTEWGRFTAGKLGVGTGATAPVTWVEFKMSSNGGTPASSGTAQANGSLRLRGGFAGVLDFGNNGGTNQWIQSTDATDLSQIYPLALNPNGGVVAINGGGILTSGDALAVAGQISGNSKVYFTNLTADTLSADRAVCQDTTSKEIKTGTGTLGACLGTSSERFKTGLRPITDGLAEVMKLRPKNYFYIPGHGDGGAREQYGFTAEDLIDVLPRLTHLDAEGRPLSVDLVGMIPVIVRSIQELKAANDNLLDQLKRSVAR